MTKQEIEKLFLEGKKLIRSWTMSKDYFAIDSIKINKTQYNNILSKFRNNYNLVNDYNPGHGTHTVTYKPDDNG